MANRRMATDSTNVVLTHVFKARLFGGSIDLFNEQRNENLFLKSTKLTRVILHAQIVKYQFVLTKCKFDLKQILHQS